MYQIIVYDQFDALLYRERFLRWEAAIGWMFEQCTRCFPDLVNKDYVPTSWQLTRI